jgi:hypothetical protein
MRETLKLSEGSKQLWCQDQQGLPFVENVKSLARGYGYMVKIPGRKKTFVITAVMRNSNINFKRSEIYYNKIYWMWKDNTLFFDDAILLSFHSYTIVHFPPYHKSANSGPICCNVYPHHDSTSVHSRIWNSTLLSGHYLRNRSTLGICVLGYIGIF